MKNPILPAYILLVVLTLVTVTAAKIPLILLSMVLKFSIIAYAFMDLKDAHLIYRIGCVAYIGAAALVFAILV